MMVDAICMFGNVQDYVLKRFGIFFYFIFYDAMNFRREGSRFLDPPPLN